MRILQLHDETWDSGIAHYALTLSSELQRRGHEVYFWGVPGSFVVARAREAGLQTLEIQHPWLSLASLRAALSTRRIELVNAHTGSSHTLAAALVAGRRVPVVRTRADARPASRRVFAHVLAARTRAFIAANSRIRRELSEAFPSARVELILQGLPPATYRLLPKGPLVGLLGRLDPVKGHEDFMAAAGLVRENFPDARFLAAGGGTPEQLARLRGRAGELGLDGRLKFLGRVPDPREFIAGCRVGVVASTGSEAVSRATLEWMSLGRPLVATAVGCLPDLVKNGETGLLVPPGNPAALAEALRRLLKDPETAADIGRKARERFEDLFSLRLFVDKTERLYKDCLGHLSS